MNLDRDYFAYMKDLVPLFQERLSAGQTVRFSPRGISMLPMLRQGIDDVDTHLREELSADCHALGAVVITGDNDGGDAADAELGDEGIEKTDGLNGSDLSVVNVAGNK